MRYKLESSLRTYLLTLSLDLLDVGVIDFAALFLEVKHKDYLAKKVNGEPA
jgi:hypothetical protein